MQTTLLVVGLGLFLGFFLLFLLVTRHSAASALLDEVTRQARPGGGEAVLRRGVRRQSWIGWQRPSAAFVAASVGSPTLLMSDA